MLLSGVEILWKDYGYTAKNLRAFIPCFQARLVHAVHNLGFPLATPQPAHNSYSQPKPYCPPLLNRRFSHLYTAPTMTTHERSFIKYNNSKEIA